MYDIAARTDILLLKTKFLASRLAEGMMHDSFGNGLHSRSMNRNLPILV